MGWGWQLVDVPEIIINSASRGLSLHREVFPQELTVMDTESARSIDQYYILIKLIDFNDEAHLVGCGPV